MKLSKLGLAPIAAAVMAMSAAPANAAIFQSYLEYSDVAVWAADGTSNTPPYFGLVTLTEVGSGTAAYVHVHVDLYNGFQFVDTATAERHSPFAFNLTNPGGAEVVATPPWVLNSVNPTIQNPFGWFTTALDCCDKGGSQAMNPPLDFDVKSTTGGGLTFLGVGGSFVGGVAYIGTGDRFSSNADGFWFTADLLGMGATGIVAARDLVVTAVPEPETYAMLLAGLGLLGFAARRRKLKEAVAA